MASLRLSFFLFLSFVFEICYCQGQDALPQVDLGYTIIQAQKNGSDYFNFNNIRYAEAPLGDLRFSAPIPPQTPNRTVNDGSNSVICPQAQPSWIAKLEGVTPSVDPRENEDCLFLDVMVPQGAFNARQKKGIMPVLVWIYGGGYVGGEKTAMAAGLIAEAQKSNPSPGSRSPPGMVFVAMNYRLGLFGWLSGPTLQANGTANAGLYDQRLALNWVQQNIDSFGGDPSRVTIMGESAGGGSIMHQITAYGGNLPPNTTTPFQRAILQSPGFGPVPGSVQQENIFDQFLSSANVTTLAEARGLDTQVLQSVNRAMVASSPYGGFLFNPVVDGSFVPGLPGQLLSQGSFNTDVSLLLGHNLNEGAIFTSPNITSDEDFFNVIRTLFPQMPSPEFNYVIQSLYPPIFNDTTGTYPYKNNFERTDLLFTETAFICNNDYLARAFGNKTYNYIFSIQPGFHGQDIPYTFYVPGSNAPDVFRGAAVDAGTAVMLQDYITGFVISGDPNSGGGNGAGGNGTNAVKAFGVYGDKGMAMTVGGLGSGGMVMDPARNRRCSWWQEGLYF